MDLFFDWVSRIGGLGGIIAILTVVLYIRQNRRKLDSESKKNEASANLDDVSAAEKIEEISVGLAEEYEKRYKELRKVADEDRIMVAKLVGRFTRVIQLIRLNIEYRSGLPMEEGVRARMEAADKKLLDDAEKMMTENGHHQVKETVQ